MANVIPHCTTQFSKKKKTAREAINLQILRQHRLWTAPFAGNEQKKKRK